MEENKKQEAAPIEPILTSAEAGGREERKKARVRPPMSANRKKLIAVIVAVGAVLLILATVLILRAVLNRRPPELETVRGRFEELLEASGEINTIFWGEGLPTYPRVYEEYFTFEAEYTYKGVTDKKSLSGYTVQDESRGTVVVYRYYMSFYPDPKNSDEVILYDFQEKKVLSETPGSYYRYAVRKTEKAGEDFIYHDGERGYYYYALAEFDPDAVFTYDETDEAYYDYVRTDSGYLHTDDIKKAAEKVYSAAYLSSVYESMFTGIMVSDRGNATLYARYYDYEKLDGEDAGDVSLVKNNRDAGYALTDWVYDYSTMKMVKKSNATYVTVEIERYPAGKEAERQTVKQYFALENGQWYLDAPSY